MCQQLARLKHLSYSSLLVLAFAMAACDGGVSGANGDARIEPPADAGPAPDASQNCGLQTCSSAAATCGPIGDGCGGVQSCGTCTGPETCGGGGTPSTCGQGVGGCTPVTCAQVGANCGPVSDGCGFYIDCGTCTVSGETCGGGGTSSVCGTATAPCVPKTCADVGANCGPIGDGCGGSLDCGTCTTAGDVCGGGGPSKCGPGVPCTNLCQQQMSCGGGATTSLSGSVFTPRGDLPLYGVDVYVPNAALDAIATGATCDQCETNLSGEPLVFTRTDSQGKFKLNNVPVGTNIPLVIQVGKWRRLVTIANVAPCVDNPVPATMTRLPRRQKEFTNFDNIPRIALTTGGADGLECLLRKIGIADAEFTPQAGAGRVNLYAGVGGTDQYISGLNGGATFSNATVLWDSATNLKSYDIVVLSCEGTENPTNKSVSARAAMKSYLDAGGRVFASHWHNFWVEFGPAPFPTVATFNHQSDLPSPSTVLVKTSFARGLALAEWLFSPGVGASTTFGELVIQAGQHTIDAVNLAIATTWIFTNSPTAVQYLSFLTPLEVPEAQRCGKMVLTDIHVAAGDSSDPSFRWPSDGCTAANSALLPEEKALIFLLFDLASCVDPTPPGCVATTCAAAGANCGPLADGCGGLLDCGVCTSPQTCGGGGTPNVCGGSSCTAQTCADFGYSCGYAGDGCGNLLQCGFCDQGQTCGGGGTPGVCGNGSCAAQTCQALGADCGLIGDGCGGVRDCGECTPPLTCGGGGVANKCGQVMIGKQ